jgi:hypothetical protein
MDIDEADIIRPPLYPVLKLGDNILWDFTNFDKADKNELLTNNDILQPKKKNENYIAFCKCDFNIKALIHERGSGESFPCNIIKLVVIYRYIASSTFLIEESRNRHANNFYSNPSPSLT